MTPPTPRVAEPESPIGFSFSATRVGMGTAPGQPTGGLAHEREYSTGYSMRPTRVEELPLLSDVKGGRVSVGVILAVMLVVIAATLTTVMVFAAGR